jgi:hypothetical protein
VEFIVDAAAPMPSGGGKQGAGPEAFFFMEMNTRLQVSDHYHCRLAPDGSVLLRALAYHVKAASMVHSSMSHATG